MITSHYSPLFAVLLALAACAKGDEGSTDTADQTTTATTTATTPATTGATTTTGDASSGEASTHASHGGTDPTTTGEPTTTATTPATTGETTGDATTADATTGGGALGCDAYCETMTTNCPGAETQYGSKDTCLATCAAFPPGTPADTIGNSLGCRSYHAGAAAQDPTTHCTHAGPGGNGVCGGNCESFCVIAADACPDAWPDDAACQTACGTFAPEEKYDAGDVKGNTFACRLYHLTAAALDPDTHCAHIKGDSAPCM